MTSKFRSVSLYVHLTKEKEQKVPHHMNPGVLVLCLALYYFYFHLLFLTCYFTNHPNLSLSQPPPPISRSPGSLYSPLPSSISSHFLSPFRKFTAPCPLKKSKKQHEFSLWAFSFFLFSFFFRWLLIIQFSNVFFPSIAENFEKSEKTNLQ